MEINHNGSSSLSENNGSFHEYNYTESNTSDRGQPTDLTVDKLEVALHLTIGKSNIYIYFNILQWIYIFRYIIVSCLYESTNIWDIMLIRGWKRTDKDISAYLPVYIVFRYFKHTGKRFDVNNSIFITWVEN